MQLMSSLIGFYQDGLVLTLIGKVIIRLSFLRQKNTWSRMSGLIGWKGSQLRKISNHLAVLYWLKRVKFVTVVPITLEWVELPVGMRLWTRINTWFVNGTNLLHPSL